VCGVTSALQGLKTPLCGCFGCDAVAEYVIDHPKHGERVVCPDHAEGYEVVDDV